ncbi:MAG: hypothetical protein HYY46_21445 [Deltaproteobacteria bacterium]|nr:hypothetical protein [Deltaproteobacteria bacterium]
MGAIWRAWFPKFILWLLLARAPFALAEEWSQAYISTLPDAAFAAIETAKDGKKLRHLPHHDHTGALDIPHLKSARARLKQVKWKDPANADNARLHLEQHWREHKERMPKARGAER